MHLDTKKHKSTEFQQFVNRKNAKKCQKSLKNDFGVFYVLYYIEQKNTKKHQK
jgi:hypothetical protein